MCFVCEIFLLMALCFGEDHPKKDATLNLLDSFIVGSKVDSGIIAEDSVLKDLLASIGLTNIQPK